MTDNVDPSADEIIARAAAAFDAAWRQWGPPTIKFYLRDVRPDCRQAALMALVRIDLEHRHRLGERPSPVRYAEQFPRIFCLGTPERQRLNEIVRELTANGVAPSAAPVVIEAQVGAAVGAAASGEAEVEPSDWIESLGSFAPPEADVRQSATSDFSSVRPAPAAVPRRRQRLSAAALVPLAVATVAAGGVIYLVINTGPDHGSVSASTNAPNQPKLSPPESARAPLPHEVDLLPFIDPSADAASGAWNRSTDGALDSDASIWAMLRIPYQPPEEYDLEAEFERLPGGAGGASTGLVGSARGTSFEWNAWLDSETCGFWLIDGKPWREGPEAARGVVSPSTGGRHTARLSVRRDGVAGYLDGVLVASWKTDFHDLSLPHTEEWGGPVALGLRTYENPTRFFSVKLTERSATGRPTREMNPVTRARENH
jgi:hypothetical protein